MSGPAERQGPSASGSGDRYPWVAMGAILAGTYLAVLNTTVLGVALPQIAADLGTGARLDGDWVLTAYLVAVVLVQPITGWMADRWGRKTVYMASLWLFGVGSLLCVLAPTMGTLVAARVLQGLGAGALMPVGMAMIYELFPPHRRGTALGIWGVAIMAAPALGPPVGGWVVTNASWRWVFVAFVAITALALVLGARLLRDEGFRQPRPFHWLGWGLASVGIVAVVMASRQAADWGLTAAPTVALFAAGVAALVAFTLGCLRREHPLIEFRMFAVPTFAITAVVIWLTTIAQFAQLNILPVGLQVVRGLSAQEVGLLLAPAAVGVAATMPLGGWLADRIGPRLPVLAGVALMSVTTWQLAQLTVHTPLARIVAVLIVQGVGVGLAVIPNTVAAMLALPQRFVAQASAVQSLNRQLSGALGTAVLAALVVAQLGALAPVLGSTQEVLRAQAAYNRVFLITSALLVGATLLALALPGRRRTRATQAARARDYQQRTAAGGDRSGAA